MNLASPILDVVPGPRGRIFTALVASSRPLSMRELAAQCGIAHTTASDIATQLSAAGLTTTTQVGRSSIVSLNREHLAVAAILDLVDVRAELVHRLRDAIGQWPAVHAAWMFGSAARGDGTTTSDIDVLVVHTMDDDEFDVRSQPLSESVLAWTGNRLEIVDHHPKSWAHLVESRAAIVDSLRRDGIELIDGSRRLLRSGLVHS